VLLAWLVTSRTYVAYLGDAALEATPGFRSTDPEALLKRADSMLNPRPSPSKEAGAADTAGDDQANSNPEKPVQSTRIDASKRDEIRKLAETALANDPLNARALRILGQLAIDSGDEARAYKLMHAAVQRSNLESFAISWLMLESYKGKDYAAAIYYADLLLRTRPDGINLVMPTLARMTQTKEASAELKKLIAGNPPWRSKFFNALPFNVTDARKPLDLLLSIRDTPTPPTSPDLRAYLNRLIQHKFYELAFYTWLQFLPPAQLSRTGLLFNGSFELTLSKLPFDWVISAGAGASVETAMHPDQDGRRALKLQFDNGRVNFGGVRQMIVLAPGNYRLEGKYKGRIIGRRGLLWRVTCVGARGKPIGESQMVLGVTRSWKEFDITFEVPATDCRAQQVRLVHDARSASEKLVTGSMWYDELKISRSNGINREDTSPSRTSPAN
jgi:hypothetical protein